MSSKEQLDRAYDLIVDEQYLEARAILLELEPHSSTARRWLANVDALLGEQPVEASESEDEDEGDTLPVIPEDEQAAPDPAPFDARPLVEDTESDAVAVVETGVALAMDRPLAETPPAAAEPQMQLPADAVDEPLVHTLLAERAPVIPPDAGELAPPMLAQSAGAVEDMPIDQPGEVIPVGADVPAAAVTGGWEYREIVVKTWQQHMSNIEYALEQGGEKITIEDAYTKLLNETGAQGWEVIREEVLPQQYVRLLMKRPTR